MGVQSIGEDFLRTIENFALAVGNVTSATNKSGIFLNEEDISELSWCLQNLQYSYIYMHMCL